MTAQIKPPLSEGEFANQDLTHLQLKALEVNGQMISGLKTRRWLKKHSTIKIRSADDSVRISIAVIPDDGAVNISPSSRYPLLISLNGTYLPNDSLQLHLDNRIRRFKIELQIYEGNRLGAVIIDMRMRSRINLTVTDFLILPLALKAARSSLRFIVPKKAIIIIQPRMEE